MGPARNTEQYGGYINLDTPRHGSQIGAGDRILMDIYMYAGAEGRGEEILQHYTEQNGYIT